MPRRNDICRVRALVDIHWLIKPFRGRPRIRVTQSSATAERRARDRCPRRFPGRRRSAAFFPSGGGFVPFANGEIIHRRRR